MTDCLDVRYVERHRTAVYLSRLCYRVALSIEKRQPVSALKLLEASLDVGFRLNEMKVPFTRKSSDRNLERALRAARCTRAILNRLQKERQGVPAQVTAAIEISERVIGMLETKD